MPRFRPVLTPGGFVFLAAAVAVLIRSLIIRNSYEIVLASGSLFFLLVLCIFGEWKARKLKPMEAGWKMPFPMTANAGEETLISGLDAHIPAFFRLHFIVSGRFFASGFREKAAGLRKKDAGLRKKDAGLRKKDAGLRKKDAGCFVSVETSIPRGETSAALPLDFPMSGIFEGDGCCRLRDIFGFFSFPCGQPQKRIVNVRSAPYYGEKLRINAQSGAEDRRNKNSDNEERYYMREYAPGDRFRDINWKSSERIDALITRISPDNQEKVSRVEVHFRNFGPVRRPSLDALWLLDRAKARLSHFLRSLKEEQPSYIFEVHTSAGCREIEDQDDLDAFLEELAGFSFSPPQNESAAYRGTGSPAGSGQPLSGGQLYVFSTACDAGLSGFILACNPRPVTLFLVQPAALNKITEPTDKAGLAVETEPKTGRRKPEILRIGDFPSKGCVPPPGWFIRGKIKHICAPAGKTEMSYAETKL